MNKKKITHLKNNRPNIVDISKKSNSSRTAIAQGTIKFSKNTFKKIHKLKSEKGEIVNVAILAGIMASKKTSELIPLCHNIMIEYVKINVNTIASNSTLKITCAVKAFSKTGVEMEALTGLSITCLTIYDMCKGIDKSIEITDIKLISKTGGKNRY